MATEPDGGEVSSPDSLAEQFQTHFLVVISAAETRHGLCLHRCMDGRFLNEVVAWKSEGETHLPNGRVFPRISYVKLPDKRAAAEALSHEYSMATFAIDRGQPLTKEVLNDERQLSSRGDSALRLRQLPNARFVGCRTEALTVDPLELTQVIQQDLSVSPLPNDRGSTKEAVRELLEVALCVGLVAVIGAAASAGTLLPW